MDIEYIQTSNSHRCVRKLYILAKDGVTDRELEFFPCVRYKNMDKHHQRTFHYCKKHIHNLSYYPEKYASPCSTVFDKLNNFIVNNGIDFILYKGGNIERNLCEALRIPSYNIECFHELEKVYSHDPRTEVNAYFSQLVQLL